MNKGIVIYIMVLLSTVVCGCRTGIESTKTIKLSKSEQKEYAATPEELLMEELHIQKLTEWQKGKPFIVADSRIALVFDPFDVGVTIDSLVGKEISFSNLALKPTPGGSDEAVLVFTYNDKPIRYSTGKSKEVAEQTITSMDVPMVIDPKLVNDARTLLKGKKVWTKTKLWYDSAENKFPGKKFVPVTITDVNIGSIVFPLKVSIKDESGKNALFFMNIGSIGIDSRTFKNLFSLSDPKDRYPNISPGSWEAICSGEVKLGMTKEECKLALGNPTDVNSGHDWNSTIDIWQYPDGTFLRFQDGLLISFR